MDNKLVEDTLKVLERLDSDEEVESVKERVQALLPPKDYLPEASPEYLLNGRIEIFYF